MDGVVFDYSGTKKDYATSTDGRISMSARGTGPNSIFVSWEVSYIEIHQFMVQFIWLVYSFV